MSEVINRVAMALLVDYSSVYYIDLKTNRYECYSCNSAYQTLELRSEGKDFFSDCQADIQVVVYEEDRETVQAALTRQALLERVRRGEKLSVVYRLLIGDRQVYHTMRIFPDANGGKDCIILGVLNVDDAIRTEQAKNTYGAIAETLADRFSTIYDVDLTTDRYVEYSSSDDYKDLQVPPEGSDFFGETARNVRRYIHPDDQERVLMEFSRENFVAQTEHGRKYQTEYRLMMSGQAHYVRMEAMQANRGERLIIALENIDEEVRQQEELKAMSEQSLVFTHIAESLANQYGMIYYIDTETDEYIEFTATDEYKEFNIDPTGSDFFSTSQRNVGMIADPADREVLFNALDKQTMLKTMQEKGRFSLIYRLKMAKGSSYTQMSVVWANDKKHLIMAVRNIDSEIQRENDMKKMLEENAVFLQIAESLANQYDTIYYVDMLTDHYIEFTSTNVYKSLDVRPSGDDFFSESVYNIERVIHPEDRESVLRVLEKQTMIRMLRDKHMVTHTYRLLIGGGIMYARMSIIWANDNRHLIVGVMNIDQEIRKEQEVQEQLHAANEKASRDELTGVRNKGAYIEFAAQLDASVASGRTREFAVVVCDVNGLKQVNDQYGHIQGDEYIRAACRLICQTWAHSPVFRVGGDEFAVILQNSDYHNRHGLLAQLNQQNRQNAETGEVVVAIGMAEFDPAADATVAQVFDRADDMMYRNKSALKQENPAG